MDIEIMPLGFLPAAWIGALLTTLTYIALGIAGYNPQRLTSALGVRNEFIPALLIYALWTALGAWLLLYMLQNRGITAADVGLTGGITATGWLLGLGGAVCGVALWWLVEQTIARFGLTMFREERYDGRYWPVPTMAERFALIALGAVVVPIAEEIIFRGYVQQALDAHMGNTALAVALTAVAFASIHGAYGVGAMLYALLVSVLLSGICLLTGSLYPAMLAHGAINLWSFAIMPILIERRRVADTD